MIHVIVNTGSGFRRAPVISDNLIGDINSAYIRAYQELARATYIVMSRTLELPHDPVEGHAVISDSFAYQPLGIFGRHVITSRTITLTPTSAMDSITLEQYRDMVI